MSNGKFIGYELVNYSVLKTFNQHAENRTINRNHVNKLKEQVVNSLPLLPPITVNKRTLTVIDGHHRMLASLECIEEGRLPEDTTFKVMYVDIPTSEEKGAIVDANTNSKNWSLNDFINSYAKTDTNYKQLETWCKNHALCVDNNQPKFRYGAAIIKGKNCAKELKNGEFTLDAKELALAETIHSEMIDIIELYELNGKGPWIEALALAWHQDRHLHTFKEWYQEMKHKKRSFMKLPKANKDNWINILAQIHRAIDTKK